MGNLLSSLFGLFLSTSNNGNRNKLDNLNTLVYYHLFKYLDLDDVLELRLISKRFYSIVHYYYHESITQLSFIGVYNQLHRGNWFSTTKSIKLRNQLKLSKLGLLINSSNNLINLKYLRINNVYGKRFKIEDLNKFTKLQILIIEMRMISNGDLLQLPDLKALSIKSFWQIGETYTLMVDCPNLQSLQFGVFYDSKSEDVIDNLIKFKNPLSIKHLEIYNHDRNISIFKNLECLELIYSSLVVNDLLMLKSLKKLRIQGTRDADNLKHLLRLKKNDLEIYLDGVKIKETNVIDECKKVLTLKFQLDNYDELEDNLSEENIDYSYLIRLPNQPADQFRKFINVTTIYIGLKIENEDRLISFIRECPSLNRLFIKESSLSQQFYDRLPEICLLSDLWIRESGISLNYKFLMKLIYLSEFRTDHDILINDNPNLKTLYTLKYLKMIQFNFCFRNKQIIIKKEDKHEYRVDVYTYDKSSNIKFIKMYKPSSLDKIVKLLNYLRN